MKKIIFFLVLLSSLACKAEYISLLSFEPQYLYVFDKQSGEWWGPDVAEDIMTMVNIHDYEGARYIAIKFGDGDFTKYYIHYKSKPLEESKNQKTFIYNCVGEDNLKYIIKATLYEYQDDIKFSLMIPNNLELVIMMSVVDYSEDKSRFAK